MVFDVPEILSTAHEWYMSAEKYLTANQTIEWTISLSLIAISVAIFFKSRTQKDFPLMILRLGKGVEVRREYKKSVQQTGKIYKL